MGLSGVGVGVCGGGRGFRLWVGGGHCPGSCSEWLSSSGWLWQFSSARTLRFFFRLWHLPSWCDGWSFGHELQYRSWVLLVSPLVYAHSVRLSLPRTPLGNPYRESRIPLLSVSALGSCFWIGLDSLFSQGKLLANGNYTSHPEKLYRSKRKKRMETNTAM